jgi:uncharacterized damage-inducible protein DinB
MSLESLFVNAAVAKLRNSTDRIGTCLGRLNDDQIWARGHESENAVGNLLLHLEGNVRQWIISGLGGAPDTRVRDREFAARSGIAGNDLVARLKTTIDEATQVVSGLTGEQLTQVYEVQNRKVSGVEAVLGVIDHFAQHTGQIIFATKNLTGEDLGLSVPRK